RKTAAQEADTSEYRNRDGTEGSSTSSATSFQQATAAEREIAETPETSKRHVGVQLAGNNPRVAFVPSNVPLHSPSIVGMFDERPRLEKQFAPVPYNRLGMHPRGERSCGQGQRMGEQCGAAKSGVVIGNGSSIRRSIPIYIGTFQKRGAALDQIATFVHGSAADHRRVKF